MALLSPVLPRFQIEGSMIEADQIYRGHINRTYVTTMEHDGHTRRYVHQWINRRIFLDPPRLMENIQRVVDHVNRKRPGQLKLVPHNDGTWFYQDEAGEYWRTYEYVENHSVYDVVDSAETAYEAAVSFGQFLDDLSDLDAKSFHITIPDFHNTPKRLEQLAKAELGANPERLRTAAPDLDFVKSVDHIATKLTDVLERYPETERVTHNDTKVNNVLFDALTGKGKCVIDLDTVMPGSVLYDVGDLVRTACNRAAEDEPDVSKVVFDADRFAAIVKGFAETTGSSLHEAEWEAMPYCGAVITYECGVRFLADYLNNDVYFATKYDDHNLVRARVQFALVKQMLEQIPDLTDAVRSARG